MCGHGMSAGRTAQPHARRCWWFPKSRWLASCWWAQGLLLRSFLRVLDVDLGFQPSRAAAIKIDYNDERQARDAAAAILQEILRRVSAIPGVQSAGIADMLPLDRNRSWGLQAKARFTAKSDVRGGVRLYRDARISQRYGHAAARGPRLQLARHAEKPAGRDHQSDGGAPPLARAGPGRPHRPGQWQGRTRHRRDLRCPRKQRGRRSGLEMYLPETQADPEGAELVVRSQLPPETLASSLMRTLRAYNPEQPAAEFRPIQSIVDHAVSPRRFLRDAGGHLRRAGSAAGFARASMA